MLSRVSIVHSLKNGEVHKLSAKMVKWWMAVNSERDDEICILNLLPRLLNAERCGHLYYLVDDQPTLRPVLCQFESSV